MHKLNMDNNYQINSKKGSINDIIGMGKGYTKSHGKMFWDDYIFQQDFAFEFQLQRIENIWLKIIS